MTELTNISEENLNQIENIDARIELIAPMAKLGERYETLMHLPEFKELIDEKYFKDEALRLVQLLTDASVGTADNQAMLNKRLAGVSAFQTFLRETVQAGKSAQGELIQLGELRSRLQSGEDINDILAEDTTGEDY